MSLDAILWALKDAPVIDAKERLVLVTLAETADDDGCLAYPSVGTIARRTMMHERTVQHRLKALRERGLITEGDQSAASRIPLHRRPTVYDLQIPFAWFANIDRINEFRAGRGRDPLTPRLRPDLMLHDTPPSEPRGGKTPPGRHQAGGGQPPPGRRNEQDGVAPGHPNQSHEPNHHHREQQQTRSGSSTKQAQEFLISLRDHDERLRLGRRHAQRLAPAVARALDDGWQAADLMSALSHRLPPDGFNPFAILSHRLNDAIDAGAPKAQRKRPKPRWCGSCDERTRMTELPDGTVARCSRCHPIRAATAADTPTRATDGGS